MRHLHKTAEPSQNCRDAPSTPIRIWQRLKFILQTVQHKSHLLPVPGYFTHHRTQALTPLCPLTCLWSRHTPSTFPTWEKGLGTRGQWVLVLRGASFLHSPTLLFALFPSFLPSRASAPSTHPPFSPPFSPSTAQPILLVLPHRPPAITPSLVHRSGTSPLPAPRVP